MTAHLDADAIMDPYDEDTPWGQANRWRADHMRFIEIVFDKFDTDGSWPEIDPLQRTLDQRGEDIDLHETAREIPHELGHLEHSPSTQIVLLVRGFASLPSAQRLLDAFLRVVRLAVDRYLTPESRETPRISSADLAETLSIPEPLRHRLEVVLDREPLLFAGGVGVMSVSGNEWYREIARNIRSFRNVDTSIESYLQAQARLLTPSARPLPAWQQSLRSLGVQPSIETVPSATSSGAPAVAFALSLTHMHPSIRDACASRFQSGHYGDGVQQAAIAFRNLVRSRSGLSALDGADLMSQAFTLHRPKLIIADLSTETGRSVQLGTMQLAQGAMSAIRNPVAHETVQLELAEALEMVAVISMLARKVEAAAVSPDATPLS